ncbi:FMRFamide related propeptide [Arctopsyche grandis]|uniref:FMRFamide related propeptide n=1 Tax=Arctopsyche grandis TaxID=121162 RepID=UPI00406D9AFD
MQLQHQNVRGEPIIMRVTLLIIAILPLVLGAKELLGEELPSKNPLEDEPSNSLGEDKEDLGGDGSTSLVKRSISDIAARRRSALDKNFMRFGRSDPSMVKLNGGNLMRFGRAKTDNFLRFGRARSQNVMRFGRANNNLMRFGRSPSNLMRFGRSPSNLMRFGRANNNLMRFGRANNNLMRFGRGNSNLMRFGRANNNLMRFGRGNSNLMRFGRSDEDFLTYEDPYEEEEETSEDDDSEAYSRLERSIKDGSYVDGKNDNFLRLGRAFNNANAQNNLNEDEVEANNSNDAKSSNKKNPMYYDDRFMRFGRMTTDNPIDGQSEEVTFDLLFPEESRKKRSTKDDENDNGTPKHAKENPDDDSGISRSQSEKPVSCQS